MKKSLATWALAAAGALSVSACSGSTASGPSAIAPLPNAPVSLARGKRAHPNDNGVADLHAGGADVPGYAYNLANQPTGYYYNAQTPPGQGSLFYSAPTQGTIYYCINNSTDGRKAFEGSGDSGFPPTGPCAPLGATATGFGGRQDPLVHGVLDRAEAVAANSLGVAEVEPQPVGLDLAAGLLCVLAQDAPEGVVQQVGRGVMDLSFSVWPHRLWQ